MSIFNKLFGIEQEDSSEESSDTYPVSIWSAIDGPFENPEGVWTVLVKASVEGEMIVTELYFESLESGYRFCSDLLKEKGPITLDLPNEVKVMESEVEWQKKQQ
jgi:hypothetical protein